MGSVPAAPPRGLVYQEAFLAPEEERRLVAEINRLSLQPFRMRGVTSKREVIHFGWDYLYDAWKISPAPPIPDFLLPVRLRAEAMVGVPPGALEEVLITRYPAGAGINWHRDAPMFGSPVIGVSLLSACLMKFRRRRGAGFERFSLPLAPRSLYCLGGEARTQWQHSIPAAAEQRYSITFRRVNVRHRS